MIPKSGNRFSDNHAQIRAAYLSNHAGTRLSASARAAGWVPLCTRPRAVDREGKAGARLQRPVRVVEIVVRAGIDMNFHPRAPAARARHHLLADRGRSLVVGAADQDQRRHPRAPGGVAEPPAAGIERDRGAEIGTVLALAAAFAPAPSTARRWRRSTSRAARRGRGRPRTATAARRGRRRRRRRVRGRCGSSVNATRIGCRCRASRCCRAAARRSHSWRGARPSPDSARPARPRSCSGRCSCAARPPPGTGPARRGGTAPP